jgi:cytochrome c oxidase cbb3-type subunit 3
LPRLFQTLLVLSLCASAQTNKAPQSAAAIEAGGKLFAELCGGCHGRTGEGGLGPSLATGREVRRASDEQLFQSIRYGVRGTDMPPTPQPDEKIWLLAAYVRSLSAPAIQMKPPGDPESGRSIFLGKGGCMECHTIHGQGGHLGPGLTDAGARLSLAQLREAVLDPNRRISTGYQPAEVQLRDGRKLKGVAKNYNNYSLQLLDAEGKLHLLQAGDWREVRFPEKSWMPENIAARLTPDELKDLVAFLSRQSSRSQ